MSRYAIRGISWIVWFSCDGVKGTIKLIISPISIFNKTLEISAKADIFNSLSSNELFLVFFSGSQIYHATKMAIIMAIRVASKSIHPHVHGISMMNNPFPYRSLCNKWGNFHAMSV